MLECTYHMRMYLHTRAHSSYDRQFAGGAPGHNCFRQNVHPPAEVKTLVMYQSFDVIEPALNSLDTPEELDLQNQLKHVLFPSLTTDLLSWALSIAVVAERGGLRYFWRLAQRSAF